MKVRKLYEVYIYMYRFMNYGYLFMDISFNTQTSPAYQQKIQTCAMIYFQHISVFPTRHIKKS